jgi:DNA polymerase-1
MANIITDWDKVRDHFQGVDEIAFDIETSGLSPWKDLVALIQLADRAGNVGLIHCRGKVPVWMKDLLEAPGTLVIGHNMVGFDAIFMAGPNGCGLDVEKVRWYDTMVGEQAILPMGRRDLSASLAAALERRFKKSKKVRKSELEGGHSWMYGEMTDEQVDYAINDVLHLHALMDQQLVKADELDPTGRLRNVAIPLEMAILPAVMLMKLNGMPLDHVRLEAMRCEALADMARLEPLVTERLGWLPNMNSPIQLKKALAAVGIDVPDTTKATLQDLDIRTSDPAARLILDYREAAKFAGMYDQDWVDKYVEIDGCVHPSFRQLGTDTTRFSCVQPNWQQVPRAKRKMCAAPAGHKIVSADYSGLEVRIAATVAQEHVLLEALKGADMHRAIAAQMFHKAPEDITDLERFFAKRCVFTLLFGGSAGRLYEDTRLLGGSLTLEEANDLFWTFFDTYPALKVARAAAYNVSRNQNAYTITLPNGLRRTLLKGMGTLTPATVLNTKVQGTAAVGLKCAMLKVLEAGLGKYLAAAVHDELVLVVPDAEVADVADRLANAMLDGMYRITTCPMRVEVAIGQAWEKKAAFAWTLIDGQRTKEGEWTP